MYGEENDTEQWNDNMIDILKEDYIPLTKLKDDKHMANIRRCWSLNMNMPGTIENEDPNRFIVGM